ncbi:MAG: hypothetical protein Q8K82_13215 [Gemmatimonadaceae bacterium]|nr:hypothetical protein [Gemmatimonadaceae bacterium]
MVSSQAQTVAAYLEALPEERRQSCVRFKRLDDLPMDVVAQAVASVTPEEYIAIYESVKRK